MVVNRIGNFLRERGIDQGELAEMMACTRQWVSWLCKPTTSVNSQTLDKVCAALRVQPGDLLEYVPDRSTSTAGGAPRDVQQGPPVTVALTLNQAQAEALAPLRQQATDAPGAGNPGIVLGQVYFGQDDLVLFIAGFANQIGTQRPVDDIRLRLPLPL